MYITGDIVLLLFDCLDQTDNRKKMRPRSIRRQVLAQKNSLILSMLPTDVWFIILSNLIDAKNILKMSQVSSFFTNNHNIVLTSMKLRLGIHTENLRSLVHIEKAKYGIKLKGLHPNEEHKHNDIVVKRNDPTIKCLVGRRYDENIKDISVSRIHGVVELFQDLNFYKNGCIGRFNVEGCNGIYLERKDYYGFYGQGQNVDLCNGDIVHFSHNTGVMYEVGYVE